MEVVMLATHPPSAFSVTGDGPAGALVARTVATARTEVVRLHRGDRLPAPVPAGVRSRAVYDRSWVARAGGMARIERARWDGEEARLTRRVPVDLVLVDRRTAVLPFAGGAVAVGASSLLDSLVELADAVWDAAAPLDGDGPPDAEDSAILALVAIGLKDQAIAQRLGMSPRTLRRRIGRMMRALGADTRFQAGLEAARRGWL